MVIAMKKIADTVENTLVIEKSKFITSLYRVNSLKEVEEIIAKTKKKYYDATHNCYAFILDNGQIQKCSDDGEPSKTAGWPMLEILKKNELTNVLAITTRYFGGIKLGAGGLIRAYAASVNETLKNACFSKEQVLAIYQIIIDYSTYNKTIDFWNSQKIRNTFFDEKITLEIAIFSDDEEITIDKIKNLTLGKASINYKQKEIVDIKI